MAEKTVTFKDAVAWHYSIPGDVLMAIAKERHRQNEKWGEQNHADEWWLAIISEELGEVSQAILHDKFGGKAKGTLRDELVQIAAVAVQWLECISRSNARGDYCLWTLDDLEAAAWSADCGGTWVFETDDPKGNGVNFCPFCGRVLVQAPATASNTFDEDD